MNIEEYKKAMKEINVNPIDLESLTNYELSKDVRSISKRLIPVIPTIVIISVVLVLLSHFYENNQIVSITVYAKEKGEIGLSHEYVRVNADASFFTGSSTIDVNGNYTDSIVNCNLNFKCEGQNIKSITYTCSEQNVTRNSRKKDSIYYVENMTTKGEEFYQLDKGDNFLSGFLNQEVDEAYLTYLIGNSYTVLYDEQVEKQYGLIVPAKVDENGNYHVKDIVIKAAIQMKDGSKVNKKIKIHFLENAYSLEVKIIK